MNEKKLADVIIIARGGGSLEDLWPFNEEIVARAIFESEIPVISAVGHETDFTIADFVSDLRAPTPSAAAELAVPNIIDVEAKILNYKNKYKILLKRKVELMKLQYEKCINSKGFNKPVQIVQDNYIRLDNINKIMENKIKDKLNIKKNNALTLISKLDTLSPLKTLTRGFCITEKEGKIIKSIKQLEAGELVKIKFTDGEKQAKII